MDLKNSGLIAGMLILASIFALLIGLYATGMIGGLVVGSIAQVATGGDITVSTQMNTSIAALETSYISDTTSIFSNTGLIIALVSIVVLVILFGIKFNMGTGRKSGGVE
jgi:hypothetical protein